MEVGFDLGFLIKRLRQTAQYFFGKRIADEIKALQHQIVLLQDSLVELTAYQDVMVSTGRMVLRLIAVDHSLIASSTDLCSFPCLSFCGDHILVSFSDICIYVLYGQVLVFLLDK
jgi:hypothetical protein